MTFCSLRYTLLCQCLKYSLLLSISVFEGENTGKYRIKGYHVTQIILYLYRKPRATAIYHIH